MLDAVTGPSGPHVLSFRSPEDEENNWLRDNVSPYFRFRWIPNTSLRGPQKDDIARFISSINEVLQEEEEWEEKVKPKDVTSPLLLPLQFRTRPEVSSLWEDARNNGARIPAFLKKKQQFKQLHEGKREDQKRVWIDDASIQYDWNGQFHGNATHPRCWKFSYYIRDGFHYDVRNLRSSICSIRGYDGTLVSARYLNVDPHGHIRAKTG